MKGYFLGESLDINEQITGVLDVSIFVVGVVGISGSYRDGEFHSVTIFLLHSCILVFSSFSVHRTWRTTRIVTTHLLLVVGSHSILL